MANLTANDWQQAILHELGSALAGGPEMDASSKQSLDALAGFVDTAWRMAQGSPGVGGPFSVLIQERRAFIRCCDFLLGQLRSKTDAMLGRVLRVAESQKFKQLLELRKLAVADLTDLLLRAQRAHRGVIGQIIRTAPIVVNPLFQPPGPGQPVVPVIPGVDPNDASYRGLPAPLDTRNPDPDNLLP